MEKLLGEIVDVGNAREIELYDGFVTSTTPESKLKWLLELTVAYGMARKTATSGHNEEQMARFLGRLEHCATTLESLLQNVPDISSKTVIETEISRINAFASSVDIDVTTVKTPLMEWETKIKLSSDVTELRNAFLEILALWRIQLSVNTIMLNRVSQHEELEASLKTLKQQLLHAKSEVTALKTDCQSHAHSLSTKCRTLESEQTAAYEEIAVLKEKISDMQIQLDASQLEVQTLKSDLTKCQRELTDTSFDHSRLLDELSTHAADSQRVIQLTERLHSIQQAVSTDFRVLQQENERLHAELWRTRGQSPPPRHAVSLYRKLDELDREIETLSLRMKDVK